MPRSIFFYTDSASFGGAEQSMLTLAEGLDRGVWQPTLLIDGGAAVDELRTRAIAVDMPARVVPAMPLGPAGARGVPAFARSLGRHRPDVFHAHLSWPLAAKYALMGAVLARLPAVATVQLVPDFHPDRATLAQLRALSVGMGRYIAVSGQIAGLLVERFGVPASKVEVIYNAIRLERFRAPARPDLRASLLGDGRALVLTCARLDAQKGLRTLLQAAVEFPDTTFALAGEGPERAALEAYAGELGVAGRVRFLGHRDDIPELLAACDVFALPSLYEGSPVSVLEAMAAGRAVVSSDIGGTNEVVENGRTGVLVAPRDPAALAGALRRVLDEPALRDRLAEQGYARVTREFTAQAMADRVTGVYERVLAAGGRRWWAARRPVATSRS